MSVLLWVAVPIGIWCVASVVTALALGTFLRRRHAATDPRGALRPLDVGPLDLWTGRTLDIPDSPAGLDDTRVPAPREAGDDVARGAPAVR